MRSEYIKTDVYVFLTLEQATGKAMTRKGKRLFHPIRLALTGSMSGPDIGEQLLLLEAGECFLHPRNRWVGGRGGGLIVTSCIAVVCRTLDPRMPI